jgi:hypothetical protein
VKSCCPGRSQQETGSFTTSRVLSFWEARQSAGWGFLVIRLTIVMPRWIWWLALRFQLAIALEVDGEPLAPVDLVGHGGPLTLIYRYAPCVRTPQRAEKRPTGSRYGQALSLLQPCEGKDLLGSRYASPAEPSG